MKFVKRTEINNTTKTVRRFAFLPKRIGNYIIWLEYYKDLYNYERSVNVELVNNKLEETETFTWVFSKSYVMP